jgi:hypothetical protein
MKQYITYMLERLSWDTQEAPERAGYPHSDAQLLPIGL